MTQLATDLSTHAEASVDPTPAQSVYERRAEYYDPENAFDFRLPSIPRRQFLAERDRAFDRDTGTAVIPLDIGAELGVDYEATTPVLLCRYLRLGAGDEWAFELRASGEIYFVMEGEGESVNGDDRIPWQKGDLFCFPGGRRTLHRAGATDSILFCITNEPLLALEHLQPPRPGNGPIETVHYPAREIARRFEAVFARPRTGNEAGRAILFSSPALGEGHTILPSVNVAINTLEPGGDQRPHRHNGVAVTLALEGDGVYSLIEDQRVDWSDNAAQITPPTELHSHHNRGSRRMVSLVVQDEGLHYYTRTPGFSWT